MNYQLIKELLFKRLVSLRACDLLLLNLVYLLDSLGCEVYILSIILFFQTLIYFLKIHKILKFQHYIWWRAKKGSISRNLHHLYVLSLFSFCFKVEFQKCKKKSWKTEKRKSEREKKKKNWNRRGNPSNINIRPCCSKISFILLPTVSSASFVNYRVYVNPCSCHHLFPDTIIIIIIFIKILHRFGFTIIFGESDFVGAYTHPLIIP